MCNHVTNHNTMMYQSCSLENSVMLCMTVPKQNISVNKMKCLCLRHNCLTTCHSIITMYKMTHD